MQKRIIAAMTLVVVGIAVFAGFSQQTATSTGDLALLIVNEAEVKDAFNSGWRQIVRSVELSNPPSNTLSSSHIYGGGSTSLITALIQFNDSASAEAYFNEPFTESDLILSEEDQNALNSDFNVGAADGADQVELLKVRLGNAEELDDDEQQIILRVRVGQTVSIMQIRLCIPEHPDPNTGATIPAVCFDENSQKSDIADLGLTQVEVLQNGRE
jgi:hypothetical protein